jgi:hypothetical protein
VSDINTAGSPHRDSEKARSAGDKQFTHRARLNMSARKLVGTPISYNNNKTNASNNPAVLAPALA